MELCQIDLDPRPAAAGCFAGGTSQTRRAHVLNAGHGVARQKFQTRLEQQFFLERIADLDRRTIFARLFGQFARSKRGAGQTVAPGFGADIKNGIADAAGRAARELFVSKHAETKNIYERIAFETFVEINFAADGRNPDAIAVMRNAGDDAGEKPAIGGDAGCSILMLDICRAPPIRIRICIRIFVIGPKRSELRQNSGRAPMVKMSRMIPPTPVAAPWNGSIALG